MSDLDAIRKRSDEATNLEGESNGYVLADRWYRSSRDVPKLLEIIDAVTPLVVAARNFVQGDEYDKDALEALVDASSMFPWAVLDSMGITEDD